MADPRHPRHFSNEFKRQTVGPCNNGKPMHEIPAEYDPGRSTVRRWINCINSTGSPRSADNRIPEQQRIPGLERGSGQLRMEVDVLKQASLIFARKRLR